MKDIKDIQDGKIQESKETVKKDFIGTFSSIKKFLYEIFSIRHETDIQGTMASIQDNIAVKGHTAWILVFSILVASIGLNVSSTAVVIGAMLISPLMGPILGIGLSVGINDVDTLRRSMVNLGVMLGLSLLTSFLFFSIPLFNELTPELYARTKPDVRDVLIAFAGGLALIIAISRPSPQTNTVAGVAIATALMPPLCTAGYGLAVHNLSYFFGAMFLFLINTTFIALSTYMIVKYLQFPMKKYLNTDNKRKISRIASFVASILFIMSLYTFYNLYLEKSFYQKVERFTQSVKEEGFVIIDKEEQDISYKDKSIEMTIYGQPPTMAEETKWRSRLLELGLSEAVVLRIYKGKDDSQLINEFNSLKNQIVENRKTIENRESYIRNKENRIRELEDERRVYQTNQVPFVLLSKEAKINYPSIESFSYANRYITNFAKLDTIAVFNVYWYDSIPEQKITPQQLKLKEWLKTRLSLDTIIVNNE